MLAALALLCAACSSPALPAKPPLYVLTALPLFWGEGDVRDIIQGQSRRAPSLNQLSQNWDVRPLDMASAEELQSVGRLLLIQPPRLAPHELVALDAWMRRGGLVVILADPDLRWPQQRALGDPRRAPQASLLSPLYRHWGLDLVADSPVGPPRRARIGGQLLVLAGSGHWKRQSGPCDVPDPALAICSLGQGLALLISDADFLHPSRDARGFLRGFAALNQLLTQKIKENQRTKKGELEKKP